MTNAIIDPTLQRHQVALDQLLARLERFAAAVKHSALQKTIQNLRESLAQPFLFVVIGEVKAGKSSFINTLLGSEVCEVGADPRTNRVAKIAYSDHDYSRETKSGALQEMGRPVPILQQIAIVDTPGTNSPIQSHEEITKEFIPNSDLVLFIFFAKNPYTQTAWSLLDYAHKEWQKPVVFILQQADLADPVELETAQQYLQQEAIARQIKDPHIFATSVKLEQSENQVEQGGFDPVRQFISQTITGGRGYRLKLESGLGSMQQILSRLTKEIDSLQQQLETDRAVVARIKDRLGTGQTQSRYEISSLVDRLISQYGRITAEVKAEFREGLSVWTLAKRSLLSLFNRSQRVEAWMTDLKNRAQAELESTLEETSKDGAKHFVNGIQQLIKSLVEDLDRIQNTHFRRSEILIPLTDHRYEVIEDVKGKVSGLLDDPGFLDCLAANADSVGPGVAGGGILATIGGVIAAVTEVVILDIIGSVFFGVGLLIAGGILIAKRRSLIQKFDQELDRNRTRFEREISEQLTAKLSVIYEEIDRSFADFYRYVEHEEASISPLVREFEQIQRDAEEFRGRV
ncbi:dynamin family protein [Romeria aff. gracilis LEGE 07310]|uniref:Dynamin family protein n=1 Tax=Vasconcelosia minhoensis LEGE 07310 TaxID=915328 RepID=A0A8J7DD20_9CYAN|nr:dynamin family protein [Romeria gracilis]MBE9079462.1 dynamin family protein [Romeria aff. gracilis LEGE 07310]